ncbi:hypothetical protein Vretimale_3171, partial [Volvox reticuliferus]
SIPYLKAMGAVSKAEAQRRCPGLVIKPMRTERYRRVAEQLHASLRRFAPDGQVEKTSYDDFYLDVTAACGGAEPTASRTWAGIETGQMPGAGTPGADAACVEGSSFAGVPPGAADASMSHGCSRALHGRTPPQPPQLGEPSRGGIAAGGHRGPALVPAGERNPAEGTGGGGAGGGGGAADGGAGGGGGEAPSDPWKVGAVGLGLGLDSDGEEDGRELHDMNYYNLRSVDGDGKGPGLHLDLDLDLDPEQDLGLGLDRCTFKDAEMQFNAPADELCLASLQQLQHQNQGEPQHEPKQRLLGRQDQLPGNGQQDAPAHVHVVGGGCWAAVEPWLRRGVGIARRLRAALKAELSLTVSVGVAPTKLSARLAGPSHKPDGITVVPAARLREFMAGVRIKSVPTLARKTGDQVVSELGVERVGQLAAWPRCELIARFGPQLGNLLADLPYGGAVAAAGSAGSGGACGGAVRERGPQKSIVVERSFPPITRFGGVKEALVPMVGALWERMVEDAMANRRAPAKLLLTWRQGYGAPKTKSADLSVQALQALKAAAAGAAAAAAPQEAAVSPPGRGGGDGGCGPSATIALPVPSALPAAAPAVHTANLSSINNLVSSSSAAAARWMEPGAVSSATYQGCRALLEGTAAIFKLGLGSMRNAMQVTRLAVAVSYGAIDPMDAVVGQRPISEFTKQLQPRQHQQLQQHQQHRRQWGAAAGPLPYPAAATITPARSVQPTAEAARKLQSALPASPSPPLARTSGEAQPGLLPYEMERGGRGGGIGRSGQAGDSQVVRAEEMGTPDEDDEYENDEDNDVLDFSFVK